MKKTFKELAIILIICGIIAGIDLIVYYKTGHYLFGDKYAHGSWK